MGEVGRTRFNRVGNTFHEVGLRIGRMLRIGCVRERRLNSNARLYRKFLPTNGNDGWGRCGTWDMGG